jgi:hypothetical protein
MKKFGRSRFKKVWKKDDLNLLAPKRPTMLLVFILTGDFLLSCGE